jgi:hypothetical protein
MPHLSTTYKGSNIEIYMYIQNKTPPLFEHPKIYDHVTKLVEEVQAQFIWANPINLSYSLIWIKTWTFFQHVW